MIASQETASVRGVLDRFVASYSAKDETGVLGCFAVGDDGVLVGTGEDEWRVGDAAVRAQVERDFARRIRSGSSTATSTSTGPMVSPGSPRRRPSGRASAESHSSPLFG